MTSHAFRFTCIPSDCYRYVGKILKGVKFSPFVIYKITNTCNNKSYIGKAKKVQSRFYLHLQSVVRKAKGPLYAAITKYGIENFTFEIIKSCITDIEANEAEKQLIVVHNTLCPSGYNITAGGTGGDTFSGMSVEQQVAKRNKLSVAAKLVKNRKPVYERWVELYGKAKATQLKKLHRGRIEETKRQRRKDPIYREREHRIRSIALKSARAKKQNWFNK